MNPPTMVNLARHSTPAALRQEEDETLVSEITIADDGRVFVFGASRQLLEILDALQPNDPRVQRLLSCVPQPVDDSGPTP
jgi:hypothetical protein